MSGARLFPLGWVLTAWQHCPSGSGKNSPPPCPRALILFQGVPPLPLTPFLNPDVGPTTQREEAGPCLNLEKPT